MRRFLNYSPLNSLSLFVFRLLRNGKQSESEPCRAIVVRAANHQEVGKVCEQWHMCVWARMRMCMWRHNLPCSLFIFWNSLSEMEPRGHTLGLKQSFTVRVWVGWACVGSLVCLPALQDVRKGFGTPSPLPTQEMRGCVWVCLGNFQSWVYSPDPNSS